LSSLVACTGFLLLKGFNFFNYVMLNYKEQLTHPNWQKLKLRIFERDNYACRVCGNNEHQLSVHHLCYLPKTLLWEYDDELMVTVCPEHSEYLNKELPIIAGKIQLQLIGQKFDLFRLETLSEILKKNINNGRLD
jgi:hypothetical protein